MLMARGGPIRHGGGGAPTCPMYGGSPLFPTATMVTGGRCGIPTQYGEGRMGAGGIPNRPGQGELPCAPGPGLRTERRHRCGSPTGSRRDDPGAQPCRWEWFARHLMTVRLPRSADAASPDHPEATWRTFVPVPRALAVKQISPPGVADFGEGCLEGWSLLCRVQSIIVQQRRASGGFERMPLHAG